MTDLLESIPSTNTKIIELYNKINSNSLVLSPDFQRKLVWKKQHKFHFIETILKNYPFPEIYIASAEMDVANITSSEVVVDGQQRLSTIVDYIKTDGDFRNQNKLASFDELSTEEKKKFLNYFVSVRDLKNIDMDIIKDIFMRINNTEYSLNAIEKINAQYGDGEFIVFCKQLVDAEFNPTTDDSDAIVCPDLRKNILNFFTNSEVFTESDVKRMNDLQFVMTLVSTYIESEYFNRNVKTSTYIEKYNSTFDRQAAIEASLRRSIAFYEALAFGKNSYWLSKSNTFTLLVEFSKHETNSLNIDMLRERLTYIDSLSKKYFATIDLKAIDQTTAKYFEFAKEAVNAKNARKYRGDYVSKILNVCKIRE